MTLAVVVAVSVVLVALFAFGVIPGLEPPAAPTLIYSQASSSAVSAADSSHGGGWGVVFAAGLNNRGTIERPFIGDNGVNRCSFQPLTGSRNISIPATGGSLVAGASAAWALTLRNATGAVLGVMVVNGKASIVGTGTAGCLSEFSLPSFVSSTAIDSGAAVAMANAAGGSAFLQSHPQANVTMVIYGAASSGSLTSGTWAVDYSTCPVDFAAGNTPYSTLVITMDSSNGTIVDTLTSSGYPPGAGYCAAPIGGPVGGIVPLSTAFAFGATADSVGSDAQIPSCIAVTCQFYNATIVAAGDLLQFGNLSFGVIGPTGAPVAVTGGIASVWLTGQVQAIFSFQTAGWTPANGAALDVTTQYVLSVFEVGGPPLSGDELVATGSVWYSGTVSGPIT